MPYWEPPAHEPKRKRSTKPTDASPAPYTYPHMCETEQVAAALASLPAQKRRVLRSYAWEVELGAKRVGQWLAMDNCPISSAAWYRGGGKNYPKNDEFLAVVEIYVGRALVWQSAAESRVLQQAVHKLRMHSLPAVDRLIDSMESGEEFAGQIRAANSILDRSGVDTAVKSSQEVTGPPVQIYLPDNAREGEGGDVVE